MTRVRTPCIGVCSTVFGGDVCRGCKRFSYEVIDWVGYTEEQKQAIDARLSYLLSQLVRARFDIFDEQRLLAGLKAQNIRFHEYRNPYCWIFELLRAGASQVVPEDYGFRVRSAYQGITLPKQVEEIDQDFYTLSDAHFQRYVAEPIKSIDNG
ncbi:MAG TPA: DUF1289 domain-containing protein [Pseudomonadales bacterium]|nr:DUF1289 domain-containing protein [Pseudomonadales bacterium]